MDSLSTTASIIAVLQLSNKVVRYLNDVENASKDHTKCAIEDANLNSLLTALKFRFEEEDSNTPWYAAVRALAIENGPLDQFNQALEQLQSNMTEKSKMRTTGDALMEVFKQEDIASILGKIERLKTLVQVALQMDHWKLSQAIKDDSGFNRTCVSTINSGLDAIRLDQADARHPKLMEWMSPSDFPAQQSDFISRSQEGTGQWFHEFREALRLEVQLPYKRLGSGELRLLTIHPPLTTRKDEIIRCSLEHVSLEDLNPDYQSQKAARYTWGDYIAVSYHWGCDADSPSRHIIINDHFHQVTESLEAVLQTIRILDDTAGVPWPIRYWIDAVCINQADSCEKEREILRMKDIYGQSMNVFVHLGPQKDDSDLGIELLQCIATKLAEGIDYYKTLLSIRFRPTEEDRRTYRAIIKLLCRPYWYRAWILQELAMSNGNPTVGCGEHKILFKDIVAVTRFLCLNGELVMMITGAGLETEYEGLWTSMWVTAWANKGQDQRQRLESSRNATYLDLRLPLLTLVQNSQATKPHDKVYSLLGLLPDVISSKMKPYIKYGLPVNTVFAAFSRAVIEFTDDLDIIFARNFEQTMSPSWATDWQLPFDRAGLPHDWQLYCYDQFQGAYDNLQQVINASRESRADGGRKPEFHFMSTSDNLLLKCSGFCIGTVGGIAPDILDKGVVPAPDWAHVQPICLPSPYGDDRATSSALVHTLFANPKWGDSEAAALFHIPWLAGETSPMFNEDGSLYADEEWVELCRQMGQLGWKATFGNGFFTFEFFRRHLGEFHIGGKKFRDYFDREIVQCSFPDERIKLDMATVIGTSIGRRLITLSTGHFGLAPSTIQTGDGIYVLLGCSLPIVLRPVAHTDYFTVIGECYVEGFANGEAMECLDHGKFILREVVLC